LNFSAGVIPSTVGERITDHLDRAQGFVDASPSFAKGDTVVITAGQPRPEQTTAQTNLVKIYVK
jgi:pyruvate kinase